MKEPVEPNKEDCCNSGCNPCIFDVYEKQMKLYQKFLETGQTENNEECENAITQLEYSSFMLVDAIKICKGLIQLYFKMLVKDEKKVRWKPGDHFLLKYNDKDVSCTRAYTPVKCMKRNKESDFSIIVKVYENGLVSNYLNQLNIGDKSLWRGPYGSFDLSSNNYKRIVMIAQGTGIAPFISIIQSTLQNEDDMTKLVLFYCTKDEDSIIMREQFYTYREYWNFSYQIFLSVNSNSVTCKYKEPVVSRKLCLDDITFLQPSASSDQFLICGSTDFMKNIENLIRNYIHFSGNVHLF